MEQPQYADAWILQPVLHPTEQMDSSTSRALAKIFIIPSVEASIDPTAAPIPRYLAKSSTNSDNIYSNGQKNQMTDGMKILNKVTSFLLPLVDVIWLPDITNTKSPCNHVRKIDTDKRRGSHTALVPLVDSSCLVLWEHQSSSQVWCLTKFD